MDFEKFYSEGLIQQVPDSETRTAMAHLQDQIEKLKNEVRELKKHIREQTKGY